MRRQLELTAPIVRSRRLRARAKLDYLTYTSQTLAPIALLGAVLGGFLARRWTAAMCLLGAYLSAGTLLSADSLRYTRDVDGRVPSWSRRLLRGFAVTVFSAHWLLVFVVGWARVALSRGPVRFARTPHSGAPAGWRPGGAQPRPGEGSGRTGRPGETADDRSGPPTGEMVAVPIAAPTELALR